MRTNSCSRTIDDNLYLSGQIGLDPASGNMVEGIENQTTVALNNMQEILSVNKVGQH